jgi:hypothetical protein
MSDRMSIAALKAVGKVHKGHLICGMRIGRCGSCGGRCLKIAAGKSQEIRKISARALSVLIQSEPGSSFLF